MGERRVRQVLVYLGLALISLKAPYVLATFGPGWVRILLGLTLLWVGPIVAVVLGNVRRGECVGVTIVLAVALGFYSGLTSAGYDSHSWDLTHIEGAVVIVVLQALAPLLVISMTRRKLSRP